MQLAMLGHIYYSVIDTSTILIPRMFQYPFLISFTLSSFHSYHCVWGLFICFISSHRSLFFFSPKCRSWTLKKIQIFPCLVLGRIYHFDFVQRDLLTLISVSSVNVLLKIWITRYNFLFALLHGVGSFMARYICTLWSV